MASYRLSRKAADDLDTIYSYTIEQHGLAQAKEYLNLLQRCFEQLADHPGLGRRADRIAPRVRRHECQAHVVFYLPEKAGAYIVRVLHGRMDLPRRYAE